MGNPGQFSMPKGEDWMIRELQNLRQQVQRLSAANIFGLTGIRPGDGGADLLGYVNIEGQLDINGPTNINGPTSAIGQFNVEGPMVVDGDSEFNGALYVNGPLHLQPGSIENDALTNPVQPGSAGISDPGKAYSTTPTTYALSSIPIPAGFTQALVFLGVSGGAVNSAGVPDYIYVAGTINGISGAETPQYASVSGYASASAFAIRHLTGLTTGNITVGAQIRTGTNPWAANTSNVANSNAIIQFLR